MYRLETILNKEAYLKGYKGKELSLHLLLKQGVEEGLLHKEADFNDIKNWLSSKFRSGKGAIVGRKDAFTAAANPGTKMLNTADKTLDFTNNKAFQKGLRSPVAKGAGKALGAAKGAVGAAKGAVGAAAAKVPQCFALAGRAPQRTRRRRAIRTRRSGRGRAHRSQRASRRAASRCNSPAGRRTPCADGPTRRRGEIGRASCRERV